MISFDEAIGMIRAVAKPIGVETVALDQAAARVLSAPVVARIDSPRADVSAMDGYAVRDADVANPPARLDVVGESAAGAGWSGPVSPGTCVRIFTGAPVPAGADRVVIQENVAREGDAAIFTKAPGPARHIRSRGSDFSAGDQLLPAGRNLDARAMVAAAGADVATVEVYRRPRLHILSTGDELAEPGTARERANAVPDSVSLAVAILAEQWGASCVGRTRLSDELSLMHDAAAGAVDSADIVVVTGGASIGERDFAKSMFGPPGLELLFSRMAIRPGKPAWLGRASDRLVIGLPGNPTSALVTARLLLSPLIAGMTGRPIESALAWRPVQLGSPLDECGERETFHRARLTGGRAEILPFQESYAQKALAEAALLVRQPAKSAALDAGKTVDVLDF